MKKFRYEISKTDLGNFRNTTLSEKFDVLDPDGFIAEEAVGDAVLQHHGWVAEKTEQSESE